MVPLRDDNPTRITPYVTWAFIGLNCVLFLYELSLTPTELNQFFQLWAVVPRSLTLSVQGGDVGVWLTLVTSQFLHGGFLHLGGNMLFLWVFGNNIEDCLGHGRFVVFYLVCGVLAALAQYAFSDPLSVVPLLGASGAIAGVLGAYIIRFPRAQVLTLIPLGFFMTTVRLPAVLFLGFWFVQQALLGLASLPTQMSAGASGGGIAYWAHSGGFVFGVIVGPLLGLFAESRGDRYRR